MSAIAKAEVKPVEIVRAFAAAEQSLDAIPQYRVDHRWDCALEADP